ncbi:putative Na+-dependent transporter [Alkalihalobacillus xiaoxiensis]|uniref:Na+-dependent transporter n=1 Tax=Shouchella xiaoxiensis TaxID=766895 RepID=A0ABS2SR96_9BACI|nr:bile acid:sodium symporter family protein [Shouchella xiaoxiensis]MBM7838039.1 putative Na+-dependent transporter [Shouchella xiaoxiensis]
MRKRDSILIYINKLLQKGLPFLTPVAVLMGVLAAAQLEGFVYLVPWIFALMSFANSITIHPADLKEVVHFPLPFTFVLLLLQVVMPAIAYGVGWLLFNDDYFTRTGLVLAFSIPTGIVSLMWISVYGGNRTLALCVILVNTLVAPVFIPATLAVFFGAVIDLDTLGILLGVFWMVVAPSVLALVMHVYKPNWVSPIHKIGAPFTKLGLLFVICLNSSVAAPYFRAFDFGLFSITATVFILAIIGYFTGLLVGKWAKFSREDQLSMMLLTGMRNIGVGAAIAVVYFPPAVTLPVIVGTLFQQVLAAFFGKWRSVKKS